MSDPWKFFGTISPQLEAAIADADTGVGTFYPIIWDCVRGNSSSSQICRFEWAAKTFRAKASGNATFVLVDPSHVNPDETHVIPFSLDGSTTPVSGTSWDVLEPGGVNIPDLFLNSRPAISVNDSNPTTITTAWATYTVDRGVDASIDLLWGLTSTWDGVLYSKYTKRIALAVTVNVIGARGGSVDITNFSETIQSFTPQVFHQTTECYFTDSLDPGSLSFDITEFSLLVDDEFTQPAPI